MSDERLTEDERRRLDDLAAAPYREEVAKLLRIHDTDKATLERVHAALCEEGCGECAFVRRALAGQPEAPEPGTKWRSLTTYAGSIWTVQTVIDGRVNLTEEGPEDASRTCPLSLFASHYERQPEAPAASLGHPGADEVFRDLQARRQPEAPKEQDADPFKLEYENMGLAESVEHLERDLAAANARIEELGAEANDWKADRHEMANALHRMSIRLIAANARAEKAEAMSVQARMLLKEDGEMLALLDAANARADAAERASDESARRFRAIERTQSAMNAERDQLAARATELDALLAQATTWRLWAEPRLCTPEERAELDALDAIPDSELSSSGNWYGWAKPIGVAVLANRAAKAKRGGA